MSEMTLGRAHKSHSVSPRHIQHFGVSLRSNRGYNGSHTRGDQRLQSIREREKRIACRYAIGEIVPMKLRFRDCELN
jgi:hypothetical protein